MPAGRVSMRHVREILRLDFAGISKHEIARRTGLAPSTVWETLKRFTTTGLGWPLPDDVTEHGVACLEQVVRRGGDHAAASPSDVSTAYW